MRIFTLILLSLGSLSTEALASSAPGYSRRLEARLLEDGDEEAQYIAGLFEGGLFDLVIRESEKFMKNFPAHERRSTVRYRLASALFEQGQTMVAVEHFRHLGAIDSFQYRPEALLRLGQCELLEERPQAAKKALQAALKSDQEYLKPTVAFFLGEAEFQLGQYKRAKTQYSAALSSKQADNYHAHARRGLAWCAFRTEAWSACREQCERFLQDHGKHELIDEVHFLMGDAAFQAQAFDAADVAWARISEGSWHQAATRGRAWVLSKQGKDRDAAILFARLLEEDRKGRFAREAAVQCGVHLLRAGHHQDALRVLELPAAGSDAEASYWRARALKENGSLEEALAVLKKSLGSADAEWSQRMGTLRADLLFDLGRLDEAAQSYSDDGSEYGLHAGATASLNAGQAHQALELASQFLQQFAESPYRSSTLMVRAEAHFALQDYPSAQSDFESLLQDEQLGLDQAPAIQSRLGWCSYLMGDLQQAATEFAKVNANSGEAPEAHYMEGRAHSENGTLEAAVDAWERYLDNFPSAQRRPEVLLGLSRINGDPDHLKQLLRESPDHELAPEALIELAELESQAGRTLSAIQHYQSFLTSFARNPLAPQVHYSLAWELRSAGKGEEARAILEPLLNSGLPQELGRAALELGIWIASDRSDAQEATSLWGHFSAIPQEEQQLLSIGKVVLQVLRAAGSDEKAEAHLADLSKQLKDPAFKLELRLEQIWLAIEIGAVGKAQARLQLTLSKNAEDPRVLEACFFVAERLFEAKQFSPAADLYELASHPRNKGLVDKALYKLGFARLSEEQNDAAAMSFERLVKEHGTSELFGESLYLAGESRFRLGDMASAFEHLDSFRRSVRQHAVRPKALHRLGLAANSIGKHKVAHKALTELLTGTPDFPQKAEARYEQGFALRLLDQPRAARTAFSALLAETKGSKSDGLFAARARLALGHMDVKANDLDSALSHFLKVAMLYADGQEVREAQLNAAKVLEAQGELEHAIRNYRKLQEQSPNTPQGKQAAQRLTELSD